VEKDTDVAAIRIDTRKGCGRKKCLNILCMILGFKRALSAVVTYCSIRRENIFPCSNAGPDFMVRKIKLEFCP